MARRRARRARGPPGRRPTPRRSRRAIDARRARRDGRGRGRARTTATCSSTSPLTPRRPRPAAARRLGPRQRRARPRRDVTIEGFDIDGRGGGDLGRDSVRHPRRGAARHHLATAAIRDALFGIYLREADGAVVERCRDPRHSRPATRARRARGIHVWNTRGLPLRRQRDRRRARRLLHPVVLARRDPRQRGARPALRPALHVLGRQRVRGQHLRERRRGHGAHVLEAARRSAATGSCATAASPRWACCFKACDDVLAEDNLIADNARGIFLEGSYRNHVPRATSIARLRRGDRALRLERREPLRGQLVRRQPDAARRSSAGAPTRVFDGNYWSEQRRARPRRRRHRSDRPYRLVERLRPLPRQPDRRRPARPTASPPRRSAPPSGRSRCSTRCRSMDARRWRGRPLLAGVPAAGRARGRPRAPPGVAGVAASSAGRRCRARAGPARREARHDSLPRASRSASARSAAVDALDARRRAAARWWRCSARTARARRRRSRRRRA